MKISAGTVFALLALCSLGHQPPAADAIGVRGRQELAQLGNPCPVGQYNRFGTCTACPVGLSTPSTGAQSAAACTTCASGFTLDRSQNACVLTCTLPSVGSSCPQDFRLNGGNPIPSCKVTQLAAGLGTQASVGTGQLAKTCLECFSPATLRAGRLFCDMPGTCTLGQYYVASSKTCQDCPQGFTTATTSATSVNQCSLCAQFYTYTTEGAAVPRCVRRCFSASDCAAIGVPSCSMGSVSFSTSAARTRTTTCTSAA